MLLCPSSWSINLSRCFVSFKLECHSTYSSGFYVGYYDSWSGERGKWAEKKATTAGLHPHSNQKRSLESSVWALADWATQTPNEKVIVADSWKSKWWLLTSSSFQRDQQFLDCMQGFLWRDSRAKASCCLTTLLWKQHLFINMTIQVSLTRIEEC